MESKHIYFPYGCPSWEVTSHKKKRKNSMKGKFSESFGWALDVEVLLYGALSQLPWLLELRGPSSWFLEAVSARAIQAPCPFHDPIYLGFPLVVQGTHLLNDRGQVSYEAGNKKLK